MTPRDIQLLESRLVRDVSKLPDDTIVIVPTHEKAAQINAPAFAKCEKTPTLTVDGVRLRVGMPVVFNARPPKGGRQRYFKGLTGKVVALEGTSGSMEKARVAVKTRDENFIEFPEPEGTGKQRQSAAEPLNYSPLPNLSFSHVHTLCDKASGGCTGSRLASSRRASSSCRSSGAPPSAFTWHRA